MAGPHLAAGVRLAPGGDELRGPRTRGDPDLGLPVRRRRRCRPETRHELTELSLGIWHGEIPGVAPRTRYGFRADGPWEPELGLRFNPDKLLLDPYARAVSGDLANDPAIFGYDVDAPDLPTTATARRTSRRGWSSTSPASTGASDRRPYTRWRDTVIYELHVKGMTALHDRVPEHLRGTYAGLATPAVTDYLRDLGVTAVELLPVQQFVTEPKVMARGQHELLGLQHHRLLRPPQRLLVGG